MAKFSSHPREHSLAMASADNLHKAGYISGEHRDRIRAFAGKKLSAHKEAKASEFGSLAPAVPDDDQDVK